MALPYSLAERGSRNSWTKYGPEWPGLFPRIGGSSVLGHPVRLGLVQFRPVFLVAFSIHSVGSVGRPSPPDQEQSREEPRKLRTGRSRRKSHPERIEGAARVWGWVSCNWILRLVKWREIPIALKMAWDSRQSGSEPEQNRSDGRWYYGPQQAGLTRKSNQHS